MKRLEAAWKFSSAPKKKTSFNGFILIVLFLYLYVAVKSSGEAQKRSLGIIAGLFIMMVGFLFGSSLVVAFLDPLGLYIARILVEPFIVIARSAVFTFSQR